MQWYDIIIRLLLAILVGGLIGYEREFKNRPAGFRTHILVCVGAAVISMVQLNMVQSTTELILKNPQLSNAFKADVGRIGAQVISGVGFLGAGTIIHYKGSIKGLTTAATIWVVACIGLAVGMGYYYLSISSTIGVYGVLVFLKKFERKIIEKVTEKKIEIEYYNKSDLIQSLSAYFSKKNIRVKNIEFSLDTDESEEETKTCFYTILIPRYVKTQKLIERLSEYEGIVKVSI